MRRRRGGWDQLVGSAAKPWTVLPSAPNNTSKTDPMEQLRVIGEAPENRQAPGVTPFRVTKGLRRPHGRRATCPSDSRHQFSGRVEQVVEVPVAIWSAFLRLLTYQR
jgi:hypothetical protein